jgi:hypothetical protein
MVVVLYGVAVALPAIIYDPIVWQGEAQKANEIWGYMILMLSPIGLVFPPFWANFTLLASIGLSLRRRFLPAFWASLAGVVLSLGVIPMLSREWRQWNAGQLDFPLRAGYFAWLGCSCLMAVATWREMQRVGNRSDDLTLRPAPPFADPAGT